MTEAKLLELTCEKGAGESRNHSVTITSLILDTHARLPSEIEEKCGEFQYRVDKVLQSFSQTPPGALPRTECMRQSQIFKREKGHFLSQLEVYQG